MAAYKDYSLPEALFEEHLRGAEVPIHGKPSNVKDKSLREESAVTAIDNLTLTTNSAVAYRSSLSACVDFFYKVLKDGAPDDVDKLIEAAWKEDALVTLRLIFQLRDIRNGKGIKVPFLYCLDWLRRNHFQTLLVNLNHVTKVGCWKDILDLLVIAIMGAHGFQESLKTGRARSATVKKWLQAKSNSDTNKASLKRLKKNMFNSDAKIDKDATTAAARMAFLNDAQYQQLHVCVASLFAEALKSDLESMKENKSVSLASKWAPTPCKHHDKFTLIVSTISQMLYPQSSHRKEGMPYAQYVSTVRNLYRKNCLSPLRQHSVVIERFMSSLRWNDIPYDRVPSKSMLRNKRVFEKRNGDRFKTYLEDVEKGKKTIKSSALDPHELVGQFIDRNTDKTEDEIMTTELQWEAYVKKLKEKGTLDNCMAMCDVSGSMHGTPVRVAVALSLLVAELAEEPYKGLICTFSNNPELFQVPEGKLNAKVEATMGMNWGMNTNVDAAFDLILGKAVESKIPRAAMIKRLFIFSDMQFDSASESGKTNFESTKKKFEDAGYDLPQIVFWNLSSFGADSTLPVTKDENGTALVSGFSGQLLKLFMEDITSFDPIVILMKAVEAYDYLCVID